MESNIAPTYADFHGGPGGTTHFVHITTQWRYIDDVFAIWDDTEETLAEFFDYLNTVDEDIKFTMTASRVKLQFLDTRVYRTDY